MNWKMSLITVVIFYAGIVLFANRALYLSKFDQAYWQDKFDHSQWKMPLSPRTIGDDGLYLYVGNWIVHGGDPTLINAEAPPLGKYLIGISTIVFGNGYIYGFFTTVGALIALFFLSKIIFKDTALALFATLLIAVDPLILSQSTLTMLDSLQLLLGTLVLIGFFQTNESVAGVSLGLFSATKFPLLSLIFFIMGMFVFWKKTKRGNAIFIFALATAVGYLLPYIHYFIQGHSFLDWLKVQKYIINFYRDSKLLPNRGSIFPTLLLGHIQDLFTHAWNSVPEWSPLWPIITALGLVGLCRQSCVKKDESHRIFYLFFFTVGTIIIYSFVPFWTRYLVLVLPFLYIGTVSILKEIINKKFLVGMILILIGINSIYASQFLFPTPESTIKQFLYNWKNGFFQDMYEEISQSSKTTDRTAFYRFGLSAYSGAEIESATIHVVNPSWLQWKSPQLIKLTITYMTRDLGEFSEEKTIPVVSEGGQWKISWNWGDLIDGLTWDRHLETDTVEAKRGSISSDKGAVLAGDFPSSMVSLIPGSIEQAKKESMLRFLSVLFASRVPAVALGQRLDGNSLPDIPVAMGVISKPLSPFDKEQLLSFPGIQLAPHLGRTYSAEIPGNVGSVSNTRFSECCSFLYSTTTYDGTSGIEKEENSTLKGNSGGELLIKDKNGNVTKVVLSVKKVDGSDIRL